MRRYKFLTKNDLYMALNKLRAALLAARNGEEVDEIIGGIFTPDERIKIGRRIIIAQLLGEGHTFDSITTFLSVGKNTVVQVEKKLSTNRKCFDLINKREEKVEKIFKNKAYHKLGGSKMVYKKKIYTGFKRKNVKR